MPPCYDVGLIQPSKTSLNEAITNLRLREATNASNIGYVNLTKKSWRIQQVNPRTGEYEVTKGKINFIANEMNAVDVASGSGIRKEMLPYLKRLIAWTHKKNFDAAIWTGLRSNFESKTGLHYTVENAICYLGSLTGEAKRNALDYINNAPVKEMTKLGSSLD